MSFRTKASEVDPVTEVDVACEELIVCMIKAAFPSDVIIVWCQNANHCSDTRVFWHPLPCFTACLGPGASG